MTDYSLTYTWKYQNYQLNISLKNWFSSCESAWDFACDIRELGYKLENQIALNPEEIFYTGILPTQEDIDKDFPVLTLKMKNGKEHNLSNNGNKFALFKGDEYSEEEGFFEKLEKPDLSLIEFFKSLKQDTVFEPMIFNVFDDTGNIVLPK